MTHTRSIVTATLEARQRTGDSAIATAVRQGCYQVQRVTYPHLTASGKPSGRAHIEPLTDWLSLGDAITFLDSL